MRRDFYALLGLLVLMTLVPGPSARADARHVWYVASPDHGQTFAYGSEQSRVWCVRGGNRHLALLLNFTNDPYVDRINSRQYDYFTFNFPQITLGRDGRTFYYPASDGRSVAVAMRGADFFGIEEIRQLPGSYLIVKKPHGYLSLSLEVRDHL